MPFAVVGEEPEKLAFRFEFVGTPERFRIFHPTSKMYLFVSNETCGGRNVVMAHKIVIDERNYFDAKAVGNRDQQLQYILRNNVTHKYITMSNDVEHVDDVVAEARDPDRTDARHVWFFEPTPALLPSQRSTTAVMSTVRDQTSVGCYLKVTLSAHYSVVLLIIME